MIHISGRTYELIHENKNGWNIEAFRERFSDVLERYDYVVGDWGYNQLRLKGFFRDNNPKVTRDSAFSSMVDYINEYCNFGCAYFVLHKQPGSPKQGEDGETVYEEGDTEASEQRVGNEEIYETGPSRTATLAEGDEVAQEYQQVKFLPRHQRDQRREFHHKHGKKDAPKETDKEQSPSKEGRKPFNKDRDKGAPRQQQSGGANAQQPQERANPSNEKPERADRGDRAERGERPDRGDRNERNRAKRQHFTGAAKAPVAAASETGLPQQQNRGKDQGPKTN